MALAYSAAIQDKIAYALANLAYSSLPTAEKDAIDNTWASGTPGGYAGLALTKLQRYANFVTDTGTTEVPDEWEAWLVWEVVADAATHIRPQMAREARERRAEAMQTAFSTYTRQDWFDPTGTEQWAASLLGVRLFIVSGCIRLERPLLPEPAVADACIRRALHRVWHAKDWPWLRHLDTCTIASASGDYQPGVTYASGKSFGKLLSRRPRYIGDSAATGVEWIEPVSIERMAYEQARGLPDGKPAMFCLRRDTSGAMVWEFERGTDQTYTFRAEMLTMMPNITSSSGYSTIINQMPYQERDLVRDVAYAYVLQHYGRNLGESPEAMIQKAITDNDVIASTGDHTSVAMETDTRIVMDEHRAWGWGGLGGFA